MRALADVFTVRTRWQHDVGCRVIAASDDMCRHGRRQSASTDAAAHAAAARAAIVVEQLKAVVAAGAAIVASWARAGLSAQSEFQSGKRVLYG